MSLHNGFELFSMLPVEILFTIITKYTGHYRLEKKDKNIRLISQLSGTKKEEFEKKIRLGLKPVISYDEYLNGYTTMTLFIPIRNIYKLENVLYDEDEEHEDDYIDVDFDDDVSEHTEPAIKRSYQLKKYYIIVKRFDFTDKLISQSYIHNLIKTSTGYFITHLELGENKRDEKIRAYLYSSI
jgi:hypothetical protein